MSDDVPPSYLAPVGPNEHPSAYTFPSSFTIGKSTTKPLVTPNQLKTHLTILRVFHGMRLSVEGSVEANVPVDPSLPEWSLQLDKEARWAWFVGLAVER
jgi:hypothetical protein